MEYYTSNNNILSDNLLSLNNQFKILNLKMVELKNIVPFPSMVINIVGMNNTEISALKRISSESKYIFVITEDTPFDIGVIATIRQYTKISQLTNNIVVECLCRAKRITQSNSKARFRDVEVEIINETPFCEDLSSSAIAYKREILTLFNEYSLNEDSIDEKAKKQIDLINNIGALCDYVAQVSPFETNDKLFLLNAIEAEDRANFLLSVLSKETEICRIKQSINAKVKKQLYTEQREHYIREQIRQLKAEINDTADDISNEYFDAITNLSIPKDIKDDLLDEASRLFSLPEASQEFTVITSYLDVVLSLPWGQFSQGEIDMIKAEKILEKDHYGLKKIKERILEFLAVKKITENNNSQIICLVGPPGVGKTSIAESIARACNRSFRRISLGGIKDESEIRGHRRTYIASMPGQIIDAVIHAKTMDPVILLDEIDKLGNDYKGDPTSALLEVLDPEQNVSFKDHYLNFEFDLSHVLFVATANMRENIPEPLLDRMDIIEIPSYTANEKMHIAKKHLIAKQLRKHGLLSSNVLIKDSAIDSIIKNYTREAGVRNLERSIATIMRKVAKNVAFNPDSPKETISDKNIEKYLGVPKFLDNSFDLENKIGIVNGLAYTSVGGEILPIEVRTLPGTGKTEMTGMLGDVMKESVKTAIDLVRSISDSLNINSDFYKTKDIHFHFPEGAVPKDGPSAGIGITLALISELTSRKVFGNIAITGEITLHGKVLPIGGLREKTMAAYKNGIKRVLIPKGNTADLADIDSEVKEAIEFLPVETIFDVIKNALLPHEETNVC